MNRYHRLQAVQRYLTGSPRRTASRRSDPVTSVLDPAPPGGRRERRESSTDVRLHGDEMAADADDGDADHATAANMTCWTRPLSPSDSQAGLFSPHERTLWSRSGRMTVPFDWIEDPRTTQRPRPSEPNWRKVALVLAAIAILVALAIAFGEIIR